MNDNAKTRKTSDRLKICGIALHRKGRRRKDLCRAQKELTMNKNTDKLGFKIIKKVYRSKDSIIRVGKKATEWEKIFAMCVFNKNTFP